MTNIWEDTFSEIREPHLSEEKKEKEEKGEIIRSGANHLICVTEDGIMFKSWIKDVTLV